MITLVCGKPGVGKSTYLALRAKEAIKKGIKVYSNFHILGTYKLELDKIGIYQYENCLLIIDEAQLKFNNRDFAKFKKEWADWFCLHRHYQTDVILASQDFNDVDIKLRRLAQRIELLQPTILFPFIKIQNVSIALGVNQDKTEIVTTYDTNFLKTRYKLKYPAWKLFDSFEREELQPIPSHNLWGNYPYKLKNKKLKKVI